MLAEIAITEQKCLAELVDDSIDGFFAACRSVFHIQLPRVSIAIPYRDDPDTKITVTGNRSGMGAEMLERSVRAEFSGNGPIHNLGLFARGATLLLRYIA